MVDLLHDAAQPLAVGAESAMILDDDGDLRLRAILTQPAQSVGGELHLFIPRPTALRVDADHLAAEELRRIDPAVVVLDGRRSLRLVRIAECPSPSIMISR